MNLDSSSPTHALARWAVQSRWQDLPEATRTAGRRAWLNWWACALGGARDPEVERLLQALQSLGCQGPAPLLGRSERLDLASAALAHAFASNILDYDDTHWATGIHPAGPVASALVAWCSQHASTGQDLLHAFVLGMEAACRIGMAVSPGHYEDGWHITASCGVFGAAVAVGRLMKLDAPHMAWALGHAATQASGLVASLGSAAKALNIGHAARNGLLAAQYAQQGLSACDTALEARFGFGALLGTRGFRPAALDGARWHVLDNCFKPYPCGFVLHPALQAGQALLDTHGVFEAAAVRQIELQASPLALTRADRPQPSDGMSSKLSLQHALAALLCTGDAGVQRFTDAALTHPGTQALRAKMLLRADPALNTHTARLTVRLTSGQELRADHAPAPGEEHLSLDDAALEKKLRELLAHGAPHLAAERLLPALRQLEQWPDVRELIDLTLTSP
jgi:2-methylcitrate dehydratase PrpD